MIGRFVRALLIGALAIVVIWPSLIIAAWLNHFVPWPWAVGFGAALALVEFVSDYSLRWRR